MGGAVDLRLRNYNEMLTFLTEYCKTVRFLKGPTYFKRLTQRQWPIVILHPLLFNMELLYAIKNYFS